MIDQKYQVILFYKYIDIDCPEKLMADQRTLCERLNLKGRIIIAAEGINGTLEGEKAYIDEYVLKLKKDDRFADMHIKYSEGTGNAFPRLSIKVRAEIVSLGITDLELNPAEFTATHISAQELHEMLSGSEEVHIVDMRNDYEHVVGHFLNSTLLPIRNFRDLPQTVDQLEHLKEKKVVAVCTGGVRCEKASAYLLKRGFKNVSQLYGGIVTYMENYPNQNFAGELYVFDNRVIMGFGLESDEHKVIGVCELCGQTSNNYINCKHDPCHRHFICCTQCLDANAEALCSAEH